jgi:8-oxo-dGTP pyrophosphatase MutT (NUDIX family)
MTQIESAHQENSPSDDRALKYPVSVKGVLICSNRVLLLKNERSEWELPGGKLELNEIPADCVVREIHEETGLVATVLRPLYPYIYWVADVVPVLIVPFLCECKNFDTLVLSCEHREIGTFDLSELDSISLPEGYRRTICDAIL